MPGMCGRFANSETIPVMAGRWAAQVAPGAEAWEPNTDIRPIRRVPVLLEGPAERPRRFGLMTWGWSRDFASSGKLLNARIKDLRRRYRQRQSGPHSHPPRPWPDARPGADHL
jgi:putative SOS response-associated peptidase YedK